MTKPKNVKNQKEGKKGRPKSLAGQEDTQLSRQNYKCMVCKAEKRSDKLRDHYRKKVRFDQTGQPIDDCSEEFSELDKGSQQHTKYFKENGYTYDKFPPMKRPVSAPRNPWDSCKQQSKKSKGKEEDKAGSNEQGETAPEDIGNKRGETTDTETEVDHSHGAGGSHDLSDLDKVTVTENEFNFQSDYPTTSAETISQVEVGNKSVNILC